MNSTNVLLNGWEIQNGWKYFGCVVFWSFIIRLGLSVLQVIEHKNWKVFRCAFCGYPNLAFKGSGDRWHAFFLGTIELSVFPVLIVTNNWEIIGGWIVFKTLGHWTKWKENRVVANRFLIGVALTVIIATIFLSPFVSKKHEKPAQVKEETI